MLNPKSKNVQKTHARLVPLQDCLAKTIHSESGVTPGVCVKTHCLIVGEVARELLNRLPLWLTKSLFSKGSELVAAAHDLGKVSPTFQEKIYRDIGRTLGLINPELDKTIGYHGAVSQATITPGPKFIPEILGRHHGWNPTSIESSDAEVYGGHTWQEERLELLNDLKKHFTTDWPEVSSALNSDVLAGLTTVADWVGSGSSFDDGDSESLGKHVSSALDKAGFIAPVVRKGLTFFDIFGFPPRTVQTHLVESIKTQGVYVLEAPMGIGKTEAALYAAYRILEKGEATGIYFALPTQLTSDKIYERMNSFLGGDQQNNLQGILDKSDIHRSALLLHSAAWLRATELGADGAPGHSWFNSSKRGLLAPFAVGTIDQALMAVMNVKHGFVRTFGLAGKVVILDEVHSYDSYTGTILNELVKALRELRCTVIILSATLTDSQRHAIMNTPCLKPEREQAYSPYPLISSYPREGVLQESGTEKVEDSEVNIYITPNDGEAIGEVLRRAELGEQVIWIENTVAEAQQRYCCLSAKATELGVSCGLLHSRFLKFDRQKNEGEWAGLFGKSGFSSRQKKGRILVGTQVLEQSLDIDADFLVTRLCPTDMLLQRLGRLWRHRDNDAIRPCEAKREAWILAPALNDMISESGIIGKTSKVYSVYVLCRTLEVWQGITSVNLPGGIRPLLEATYTERPEVGDMERHKRKTEEVRNKLQGMALVGVSRGGRTLKESETTTRYSETESAEVLLIKKYNDTDKGVRLRLADDSELLLPKFPEPEVRRQIACKLLQNTVSVPVYMAPKSITNQLEGLRNYVYLGDEKESVLRVAILRDDEQLQGMSGEGASEKYNLAYNSYLGYKADKKKGAVDDSK